MTDFLRAMVMSAAATLIGACASQPDSYANV